MTNLPDQVDISVVVVNWNVAELLNDCLQSIEREIQATQLKIETLVVDSASDQLDFRQVVASFPDVRLIELKTNRGYGAACNAGIEATSGTALLLLNPDTELLPGTLDELWRVLNLAPHIGLVAPLLLNPDGTIQSMGYRFPGAVNVLFDLVPVPARLYESKINGRIPAGNGRLPVQIDYALGAALCVRRRAIEQMGGFDESYFMYSEEVDLQRRLAECGWTRLLAPAARVTHFGGQSTGQRPAEMQMALWASRAACFDRWTSGRQRRLVKTAAVVGSLVDDVRNPEHRPVNRQIRRMFRTRLSRTE